ncbi:MAG: hypothetical protein QM503_11000 [Bacteroidota bacterium]
MIKTIKKKREKMPTKHIPEKTWIKVEKETVKAIVSTKKIISNTKMLNLLISIGLKHITEDDYKK